jgi:hypothetical protein
MSSSIGSGESPSDPHLSAYQYLDPIALTDKKIVIARAPAHGGRLSPGASGLFFTNKVFENEFKNILKYFP